MGNRRTLLEEPQPYFVVKPVEVSLDDWLARPFISDETRANLSHVNALIVPDEGDAGEGVMYFPKGTSDLFKYLNAHKSEGLTIDVCIEDKDYKELLQHADLLTVADFVVTALIAPVVVNLISAYIASWRENRLEKTMVKSKLTVVREGDRAAIEYEYYGPAKEYHDVMNSALSRISLLSEEELLALSPPEEKKIVAPTSQTPMVLKKKSKKKGPGKRR